MAKATVGQATVRGAGERLSAASSDQRETLAGAGLAWGSPKFIASLAALATATSLGHLSLPAGGAGAVLHMLIPALGLWLARPGAVLVLGAISATLVAGGTLLMSLPGDPTTGLTGAALGLLAVGTVTAVLYAAKREAAGALLAHRRESDPQPAEAAGAAPVIEEATPTAQIRHEVRTPLNAIIGFSEIARRELFGPLGNERYRGYMDDINTAAYQLLDVVERRLEGRSDKTASGSRRLPTGDDPQPQAAPCTAGMVPARRSAMR